MRPFKHTKSQLEDAVKNSTSMADVLRILGLKQGGGTQSHIKRRIAKEGINTSHFLGQRKNSGKEHRGGPKKKSWQEVLVLRDGDKRQSSYVLRRAMLEMGRAYQCEADGCIVSHEWLGKELRLQVDHKDGNWLNDTPENVRFLCPNCHSQTENWCNSRGLTDVDTKRRYTSKYRSRRKMTAE